MRLLCSIFVITLAFLVGSIGYSTVTIDKNKNQTIYTIEVEGVEFDDVELDDKAFASARLLGVDGYTGILWESGKPQVPTVRFFVTGDVSIESSELVPYAAKGLMAPLMPSQPSHSKSSLKAPPLAYDDAAYKSSEMRPEVAFETKPAGSVRGVERTLVVLYPLVYNATLNAFQQRSNFKVTVKNPTLPQLDGVDEVFAFIVGSQFKDSASLADYMLLKEELGYRTATIIVGEGVNTPEEIRAAIKALYSKEAGLKNALIIGDFEDVPGYDTSVISGVTDHYFRAIDTDDYDSDINGPDIGVGRIAVKNEEQLAAVIQKYTRYINGNFSRQDWLEKVAFLATNDKWELAEGTHNYAINTYLKSEGYTGVFPADPQEGGDQLYAITHKVPNETVQEVIQSGRTIINYSGHGAKTLWDAPRVTQANVRAMTDVDALPFVISNACITGDYRVDESFAETWQRHPAGAIMFWGSMDSSYWDEDDVLEKRMYDHIYRDGGRLFSTITQTALAEMWAHYQGANRSRYYWETYTIFGDPSIRLRTHTTKTLAIEGPTALPIGTPSVTFNVTAGGVPAANVRVALSNIERGIRLANVTDSTGAVTFETGTTLTTPTTLKVIAYATDAKLYEGTFQTVAANSPYLILSDFTANDRTDGGLHLGETAKLGMKVTNYGRKPAIAGQLEIKSIQGPAVLMARGKIVPPRDGVTIPNLDPDEVYTLTNGLALKVNADAEMNESITVEFEWVTNDGTRAVQTAKFFVRKAAFEVTRVDYGNATGEIMGGIKKGGTGDVYFSIKNTGNEAIKNLTLEPTIGAGCIASVFGTIDFDMIPAGEEARSEAPLQVELLDSCQNGDEVTLALTGPYQSETLWVDITATAPFNAGYLDVVTEEAPDLALAIPDSGDAVEKEFAVESSASILDLGVHIRATHTYIGDLKITLVHPDGTEVILHNRTGSGTDNIDEVYGMGGVTVPDMSYLIGKSLTGTWKIKAQDHASSDTGTLDYIKLIVKGYVD